MRASKWMRAAVVTGAAAALAGALVGCDPTGGIGAANVAQTTSTTATQELKQHNVDVNWLNCTGKYGSSGGSETPSAGEDTIVAVDCKGQTKDGKDITVTGRVTRAVDGSCVRGDLVADVAGKQVFRVSGLGSCSSPSPVSPPQTGGPGGQVTVTVTKTVWCKGDPTCWPAAGK